MSFVVCLFVCLFVHSSFSLFLSDILSCLVCFDRALPLILLVPILTQTVKTASLLAAIAALDVEVIGESRHENLI